MQGDCAKDSNLVQLSKAFQMKRSSTKQKAPNVIPASVISYRGQDEGAYEKREEDAFVN